MKKDLALVLIVMIVFSLLAIMLISHKKGEGESAGLNKEALREHGGGIIREKGEISTDKVYEIPVIIITYIPVKEGNVHPRISRGQIYHKWAPGQLENYISDLNLRIVEGLEEGSQYHGYKGGAAEPSLDYEILHEATYYEFTPKSENEVPWNRGWFRPDYNYILSRENICDWVDNRGVREVWVWGYHANGIEIAESNMAGAYGDISNSERINDMPVCNHTYTLFNYNYGRGLGEALENHAHQIEVVLNYVGQISGLPLFEKNFIGFYPHFVCFMGENDLSCTEARGVKADEPEYDAHGNLLGIPVYLNEERKYDTLKERSCGWTHYPPNGRWDYDWMNKDKVMSDCMDWTPEGTGKKEPVSCENWSCKDDGGVSFKIWWMQNIPGKGNELYYQGTKLRNWWEFIGDFDAAMKKGQSLVIE